MMLAQQREDSQRQREDSQRQREDSQRQRDEAAKTTEILTQVLDRLTLPSRARGGTQQSSRISIAG